MRKKKTEPLIANVGPGPTASIPTVTEVRPMFVGTDRLESDYGLSPKTMAKTRTTGGGPPFIKVGHKVLYPVKELEAWIESHGRVTNTGEAPEEVMSRFTAPKFVETRAGRRRKVAST